MRNTKCWNVRGRTGPAIRNMLRPSRGYDTDKVFDGAMCPYCGANSLIRSAGDVSEDKVQIEAYCTNSECDAREIFILAQTRGEAGPRADVEAVRAIDGPTVLLKGKNPNQSGHTMADVEIDPDRIRQTHLRRRRQSLEDRFKNLRA